LGIYWLLGRVDPVWLVGMLGLLLAWRTSTLHSLSRGQLMLVLAAIVVFCLLAVWDQQLRVLKLYPVFINIIAGTYCIYTIVKPPSAIERLSRGLGMSVDGPAIPYTRRLTQVWTVFFICNAGAAVYTAVAASTQTWALYNGLISYLLIGLLLVVEYPIRLAYIRRQRGTAP
jgi:uncharacterized membrane protein